MKLNDCEHSVAVHVVVSGGLAQARRCLEALLKSRPTCMSIRIWDNASDAATAAYLYSLIKQPCVTLYVSPRNFGFGGPHNSMIADATEPVICILNSDTIVSPGWERRPLAVLNADAEIAAAGPIVAGFRLTHYVEGSCLFLRREVAQAEGPFDIQAFPFAYCEDTDLSARLTRAGWRIAQVPIPVCHDSPGGTSRRMERAGLDVKGIKLKNEMAFLRRWPHAPRPERIVIRRLGAIGDVVCATPALHVLRREHVAVRIEFETLCPEVLCGNPDTDDVRAPQDINPQHYFLDFDLDGAVERNNFGDAPRHICDLFADKMGVVLGPEDRRPRMFISRAERSWVATHLPQHFIVFATDAAWSVKVWLHWTALTRNVRHRWPHMAVVWLGGPAWVPAAAAPLDPLVFDLRGRTRRRQAFAVISAATAFVSSDTGLLHVAAAFDRPSIGLFGPVQSAFRIHPGQHAVDTLLECRGCYHRQSPVVRLDPQPYCYRLGSYVPSHGTEAAPCMQDISTETVEAVLEKLL